MGGSCRSDRELHQNHHNLAFTDTESDVGDGNYSVKSHATNSDYEMA